ncbi:MAG: DNA polymerase I [Planctomycetes bacterium RBG_16_43_13]|nr:MAG: DNA polymerase I [Planctomycetes bacterium RBG_16_43_13]
MSNKKKLFVIDGSSYFYRAFYAIKGLSTSTGMPTNAIFGFVNMISKILKERRPDYIVMVFDSKEPSFRKDIFGDYKANRPDMPGELAVQIPYIKDITNAFNIYTLEKSSYEADDIIGTVVSKVDSKDIETTIVTGDKDLMQLVGDDVFVYDGMKDKLYGVDGVKEKFGVPPQNIVDILALAGDTSDNIPGVKGIGDKTAVNLIKDYGSIEDIYSNIDRVKSESVRRKLIDGRDFAFLSKRLTELDKNTPIDFNIEQFKRKSPDIDRLSSIYRQLEFRKLLNDLPQSVPLISEMLPDKEYKLILNEVDLDSLIEDIHSAEVLSINLETTSVEPMFAEIVGISFSFAEGKAAYIPIQHSYIGVPKQLVFDTVIQKIKPVLEDVRIKKMGHNVKYAWIILKRKGVTINNVCFDTMLAAYLLDPSSGSYGLNMLASSCLNYRATAYEDVIGRGKKHISFADVNVETAKAYSCEYVDIVYRLTGILSKKLEEGGLINILDEIEMPLIPVLVELEMSGVKIDTTFLHTLSATFAKRLDGIKTAIYEMSGCEFNIDSPKQLQDVLYNKLKLSRGRKIKTGYSTDVAALEKLAEEHKLPAKVLEYRSIVKLKNTYIDALPLLINPTTGRIHTTYNQSATATGRLSSSNPNLQNIPVRTDEGKLIRKAFISDDGNILVSADYSQIELRILAHISNDTLFVDAFRKGMDIHKITAAEIFGIDENLVTDEMRQKTKAINFGIIYGISAHGLTIQLGIDYSTAQAYIDSYLRKYSGVKDYMDNIPEEVREKGFVTTLMGRKRYIPDINSKNPTIRGAAERAAINTPIQGTAADLMKKAMINVHRRITAEGLKSKVILQVHDELVIDAPEGEINTVETLLIEEMEGVYELKVPLTISIHKGKNWAEME